MNVSAMMCLEPELSFGQEALNKKKIRLNNPKMHLYSLFRINKVHTNGIV